MQHICALGSIFLIVTLLTAAVPVYGQIPPPPPPTREQEGTERCWDISHPGWRTWNKESQQKPAGTKPAANQPQSSQLPPPNPLEKQKKRQEQQRQAQLEQFWQQVQAQQLQQQSQQAQQQEIFEQTKKDLLANFRVPESPVESGYFDNSDVAVNNRYIESPTCFGMVPIATPVSSGGLSPQQWQQARQYQDLINTLQHSPEMTPLDEAILEMAELKRATLWKKAASVPGLPDDAREALALRLPVTESKFPVPRLTRQDIEEIQSTATLAKDQSGKIASTLLDCIQGLPTAQSADPSLVAETGIRFGDFVGLYKIAMATNEGGISSGLSSSSGIEQICADSL